MRNRAAHRRSVGAVLQQFGLSVYAQRDCRKAVTMPCAVDRSRLRRRNSVGQVGADVAGVEDDMAAHDQTHPASQAPDLFPG